MTLENYVKFLRGTPAAYNALIEKDKDALYFISEKDSKYGTLYLGSKVIAGEGSAPESITLNSLKDVAINASGLEDGSLLIYDLTSKSWTNQPLDEVLQAVVSVMTGATEETKGKVGLVPAPKAGEQDSFLKGDGTWSKVDLTDYVTDTELQGALSNYVTNTLLDWHVEAINLHIGATTGMLEMNKVDKEEGKGLSSNDLTDELLEKINGLSDPIIKAVSSDFTISDDKVLSLAPIGIDKVVGLEEALSKIEEVPITSEGDNKVTVNEDKTMEVKSVNVNTLSQDEGDWIILYGGNSANI